MPHAVIEYSANLDAEMDPAQIVAVVHDAMLAQPIFDPPGIRTRAVRREHFRVADGNPRNAFIAITVRIGPGRTLAQRKQASEAIMQALYDVVAPIYETRGLSLSVEVTELDGAATTRRNSLRERAAVGDDADA